MDKALLYAERVYEAKPNHPNTALLFARCYSNLDDHNKAVLILKELLSNKDLDAKSIRVSYTELINLYTNIGQLLLKVETDIDNGINHYFKAFETFEISIEKGYVDYKMIKNFVESLYSFINLLPSTERDNYVDKIKNLINTYYKQISLTHLSDKLILKYSDKFHDDSLKHYLGEAITEENRKIGNIIRTSNLDDKFVFIESESERYYANKNQFIDITSWPDWKNLNNGHLVSFEIGLNPQGECAINIKLIK